MGNEDCPPAYGGEELISRKRRKGREKGRETGREREMVKNGQTKFRMAETWSSIMLLKTIILNTEEFKATSTHNIRGGYKAYLCC